MYAQICLTEDGRGGGEGHQPTQQVPKPIASLGRPGVSHSFETNRTDPSEEDRQEESRCLNCSRDERNSAMRQRRLPVAGPSRVRLGPKTALSGGNGRQPKNQLDRVQQNGHTASPLPGHTATQLLAHDDTIRCKGSIWPRYEHRPVNG